MAPRSRRGACSAHVCVNVCVETPGKSAQTSESQMSRLVPYAIVWLVTEVWPVLCVCGTAEALAGDLDGWFQFSSRTGSAGDVCQAPCFSKCYKDMHSRVGILEFSEQFLLS